jgi:hypothetical protein
MRGSKNRSIPSHLSNAFSSSFLRRFAERDEPPTSGEANAAGPWVIEEIPGLGFGLSRVGMGYARGYAPTAIFMDRWLALIAAAVLPGLGHHSLLTRRKREDDRPGYVVVLDNGAVVGSLAPAAKRLVDSMNTAIFLLSSPESLARLLEAAGSVTLERCGAMLDEELSDEGELTE